MSEQINIDEIVKGMKKKFSKNFNKFSPEKQASFRLMCLMAEHNIKSLKELIDIQLLANSLIRYCHKKEKYELQEEFMECFRKDLEK